MYITLDMNSRACEHKAQAQLWITPRICEYELPDVLSTPKKVTADTYSKPPEEQPDPLDAWENRVIAFRCMGEFSSAPIQRRILAEREAAPGAEGTVALRRWHEKK